MTLPPVAPAVVADVLDALPPRLRKRTDASLDRAGTWEVVGDAHAARAELDAETTLTWALRGGVLAAADDLVCTCLLAPRCLHRAVAAAAAPVAEPPLPAEADAQPPDTPSAGASSDGQLPVGASVDTPLVGASSDGQLPVGASADTPSVGALPGGRPAGATSPETSPAVGAPAAGPADRARGLVPADAPTEVRAAERSAANALWTACAAILRAGATGSGAVVRAELLRAVHTARVAGLHRAAAGGLRVAAALAAARAGDSTFDREVLTAELVDLLLLCHDLRTADRATAELRGTARREYRPVGALRLYGLCTEPVVTTSGYGGVVTHLVDDSGALWTVPAIMPGGAERVAVADGPVAIGESGLTQRRLGREGLLLSGGTASPDHRLGAGKAVRAVAAPGAPWDAPPFTRLWAQPLGDQVARAFEAATRPDGHRPAGADLLFVEGVVLGPAGNALRLAVTAPDRATGTAPAPGAASGSGTSPDAASSLGSTPDAATGSGSTWDPASGSGSSPDAASGSGSTPGAATAGSAAGAGGAVVLDLVGDGERTRENLRVLAHAGGLRLRVVARLAPDRPGTAVALAVSGDLALPADLRHHVDLGLDRVQRSHVEGRSTADLPPRPEPADRTPPPLRPLENVLHRVTLGGRAVAAVASASREVSALTGNGLTATAELLADLAAASRDRQRDAFGRIVRDAGDAFPVAWLRAGLHVREFTRGVARRAWLDAVGSG
ncbi:hypothetical protein GCM10009660_26190 [Catellatospora bangladeshensis]